MTLPHFKNILWIIITSKKQHLLTHGQNKQEAVEKTKKILKGETILAVFPRIVYWGTPEEHVVYVDEDFAIVRHKAFTETGFVFEVVPISEQASRLDDIEICPEHSTLFKALCLMKENREWIQKYKRGVFDEAKNT